MRIKVLGTRGEIEESAARHARHSGVLLDGKLLLDFGEREFLEEKPKSILVTHLHPDHAVFVRETFKVGVPIYAPESFEGMTIKVVRNKSFEVLGYKITPIPSEHSLKVKSQAYLIEKGKTRILYTGDMIWIKKKYQKLFGKLDLVITEASFVREGGMIRRDKKTGKIYGHAGIPNLLKYFSPYTKKIVLVHFGGWFYKDTKKVREKIIKLGEKFGVEVLVGYDGLSLAA